MGIVEWSNSLYSVKHDEFDQHHRKLLDFINDLHDSMMSGKGKETLEKILNELRDYTEYHFHAEEQQLKKVNYPDFLIHQREHQNLIQKLNDLIEDYHNNRLEVSIETSKFLKEWLFGHIQGSDKKYVSYLK
ncbi:MAG: bacteriohemerythrin [Bacteroidales bacterium]